MSRSISFLTLCVLGSSLQLCCYYDYYDASAINGEGEYGIGRGVVCGVARSRDILVYNGGYGAFVLPSFVRCPADGQAACMPRKYHLLFTTNSLSCLTQGSKTAPKLSASPLPRLDKQSRARNDSSNMYCILEHFAPGPTQASRGPEAP